MKTALITTTVNIPTVLALYCKLDPDVRFFVAGDSKTANGAEEFCTSLGNCCYLPPCEQEKWKVSQHLGWNTVTRRNIALLEALAWGADVIVTIDDDNLPCAPGTYFGDSYFESFEKVFSDSHDGLEASSPQGWFDAGQLLIPTAKHRGFPIQVKPELQITPVIDVKVGVAAGICMGDPDIDAVTRIAQNPIVHQVSELLRAGIVTDPCKTRTVWNTQNTAFIRELAPAMLCVPHFGRHDDIFASLICQHIMRQKGYYAHFGMPFVYQQRNKHNLVSDLKAEMLGMEHTLDLAGVLDHMKSFAVDSNPVMQVYKHLTSVSWMPENMMPLVQAWVADCDSVL